MNHFSVFLASLTLLSSTHAQDEVPDRRRDERKGPPSPEEFLKNYDLNQDQKISEEEFGVGERISRLDPESRKKIFLRLDKDNDGFISKEELKEMAPKHRRNPLAKADLNQDGRISLEEFAGHGHFSEMSEEQRSEIFGRLDHDGDGFLDRKDGRKGGRLPRLKLKLLDLDESGSLSWDEFRSAPAVLTIPEERQRKMFQRFDADESGEISPQELRSQHEDRPNGGEKKPRPKS